VKVCRSETDVLPLSHPTNNNNNNNHDNFYGTVTRTQTIQRCHTLGSSDECRRSAKRPPTFRPSQPTWAVSPPVGCYDLHSPLPLLLLSQKANTHFTVPLKVEGWVNLLDKMKTIIFTHFSIIFYFLKHFFQRLSQPIFLNFYHTMRLHPSSKFAMLEFCRRPLKFINDKNHKFCSFWDDALTIWHCAVIPKCNLGQLKIKTQATFGLASHLPTFYLSK